jgi:2-amino-4-hydroxy-6-hydroxymethyldihydropteridine diphosphokinase
MAERVYPVYISLGTNIEPRAENLQEALRNLRDVVVIHRISSIYETEPWGFTDQAWFLNQVVECEAAVSPEELLKLLKEIEEKMGRTATFRYGPRVIDLDILLYGNLVQKNSNLLIPHPSMTERAFVMVPMLEINPDH